VAKALGRPLLRSPELEAALRAMHQRHHGNDELPVAALRMADVPQFTRLLGDVSYPTLVVENLVMLPGVPEFLRFQFDRVAGMLASPPFRLASVYLSIGEDRLAPLLDRVSLDHPAVEIGSYPRFDAADHRVRVTFESKDDGSVKAAVDAFLELLSPDVVVRTEGR
jgi:molybdopterin-biosynthesis enzyme MoeA-like protein